MAGMIFSDALRRNAHMSGRWREACGINLRSARNIPLLRITRSDRKRCYKYFTSPE
jgi:hypothetical protein